MDDPVLTDNEFGLFELMRDEVVTQLVLLSRIPTAEWRCTICLGTAPGFIQHFESRISALDAFMKARVHIITAKLEGKEIYSWAAIQRRKKSGLA